MSKGTPSRGKRGKAKTHVTCPRCGSKSLHRRTDECSKCAFGRSKKLKKSPMGK